MDAKAQNAPQETSAAAVADGLMFTAYLLNLSLETDPALPVWFRLWPSTTTEDCLA